MFACSGLNTGLPVSNVARDDHCHHMMHDFLGPRIGMTQAQYASCMAKADMNKRRSVYLEAMLSALAFDTTRLCSKPELQRTSLHTKEAAENATPQKHVQSFPTGLTCKHAQEAGAGHRGNRWQALSLIAHAALKTEH